MRHSAAERPSTKLRRLTTHAKAFRLDTKGVAAIEFAIVLPLFSLGLLAVLDLGMGMYRRMQVQYAAQAGAEYAATHDYSQSAVTNAVLSATSYAGISASPAPTQFCGCATAAGINVAACGSTCSSGSAAGTYVSASAQATYSTALAYPSVQRSFTFASQATVRVK